MVGREPGGQPDLDTAFFPLLTFLTLVMSLMVLAGAFVAALILGRTDLGGAECHGTEPAHGPAPNGQTGSDLQ